MYNIPNYFVEFLWRKVWICVRKVCIGFGHHIFIPNIMQLQKLLLWIQVLILESNDSCLTDVLLPPRPNNPISHHRPSYLLRIQAGERSELNLHAELCLSCGLSVWCWVWLFLFFCVLGHCLEQTVELLCLPTDISKSALLCLGSLLQYNGILKSVGGILIVPHEKLSTSPKF